MEDKTKKVLKIGLVILLVIIIIGVVFIIKPNNSKPIVTYNTVNELMVSDSVKTALKSPKCDSFKLDSYMNKGMYPQYSFYCVGSVNIDSCTFDNFDKAAEICLNSPNCQALFTKQDNEKILYTLSTKTAFQPESGPVLMWVKKIL